MLSLAIISNPVSIFLIVLVIILLAPVILNKLHVPHIIGMIAAGVLVGPYGFNILDRDSSFEIFGQVGLLYLMFLAGLEIDMYRLKMNLGRGFIFGLLTFLVPTALGLVTSRYILNLDWITSALLAAMYASHTLISYPVVARFGITKSPAVLIAIVGTIMAVVGGLLTIAAAVNIHNAGEFQMSAIGALVGNSLLYLAGVIYLYPRITRWFFKTYSDPVTQFVFILAMVFLSAQIARFIGLEAVLGAFLGGLVLNRYVPSGSALMSRIEFVGNALFIPYFLIGVGMMINIRVIMSQDTLSVAGIMLAVALVSKWIPAWITQKIYGMDGNDRRVIFGLTTAHTAVALAVVTIGYNMTGADGSHKIDSTILNGTILVILITCAIAPLVTSPSAAKIKIRMMDSGEDSEESAKGKKRNTLIPIANPTTALPLVELALMMQPADEEERDSIFALHVRNDNSATSKAIGRNALDIASQVAGTIGSSLTPIERYDLNTVTGVINVIEERDISTIVLGMHRKTTVIDSFFGAKVEGLLKATNKMLVISRSYIPINTVTRIVVSVPNKAQFETGFRRWVSGLGNLARQLSCKLIFCCHPDVNAYIKAVMHQHKLAVRLEFRNVQEWDDFILLSNRIQDDDLFVYVSARANSVSYSSEMVEVPSFLQKYFSHNNLMVIYPEQFGDESTVFSFSDPLASDVTLAPVPLFVKVSAWWRKVTGSHQEKERDIDI